MSEFTSRCNNLLIGEGYYKPLSFYVPTLKAWRGAKSVTLQVWQHQVYDELADPDDELGWDDSDVATHGWAVGIANHNAPKEGKQLVRTKSGGRSQAEKWVKNARRFDVPLAGAQLDHVIDLGLARIVHEAVAAPVVGAAELSGWAGILRGVEARRTGSGGSP